MKLETIYQELVSIAQKHNITVRKEAGTFRGGHCTLNEQHLIVVNKSMPLESVATIVARSLASLNLDGEFMKPAVRNYIERERRTAQ